jgi:anti-sigma factor RsiW
MVDGVLRWAAILATLFVTAGFAMFASDELSHASDRQVTELASPDAQQEAVREKHHSTFREGVDDVNDALLRPFAGVTSSNDAWVRRGVPALLALLVYGLGMGFLARYVRMRA